MVLGIDAAFYLACSAPSFCPHIVLPNFSESRNRSTDSHRPANRSAGTGPVSDFFWQNDEGAKRWCSVLIPPFTSPAAHHRFAPTSFCPIFQRAEIVGPVPIGQPQAVRQGPDLYGLRKCLTMLCDDQSFGIHQFRPNDLHSRRHFPAASRRFDCQRRSNAAAIDWTFSTITKCHRDVRGDEDASSAWIVAAAGCRG
ncbi:hypothetical protein LF1_19640 [Rubripirellula obstinata]|uniref:Uncharacterized protein n=1 Tax=Rubripirellula obstinata TaxID=406547 RepID=A0A5B1CGW8_9BACT|nr:hypothetical protein LF1_19640 [Rubripirellula obstinata]